MSAANIARLTDRGVVSVDGRDSEKLLQGLVTNDLALLDGAAAPNPALYAALLSPQGKILFDFFIVRAGEGYLLDVDREKTAELVKRLSMYKLRAAVQIADVSQRYTILATWGDDARAASEPRSGIWFDDPRHPEMGQRALLEADASDSAASRADYDALRVRLGIPEGGKDFAFGEAYPHEANFDLLHGVSFTKGCYVGQEVVSRMQNKTIVRKRVVKISAAAPLTSGSELLIGEVPIGRIGTTDGRNALAMLRLDRAVETSQKGQELKAGGITVAPDGEALTRYRAAAEARPSTALPT